MKTVLIILASALSCVAILLACGVGQWQVGQPHSDRSFDALFATNLSPAGTLAIVRRPPAPAFHRSRLGALPAYNPASDKSWQIDLRSVDVRSLDLTGRLNDLLHADFDSRTRWPAVLPAGFDLDRIMALGKDPGLRLRELHARGITGKGVGIGIVDSALLVNHAEYRDRLRLYEEIHSLYDGGPEGPADMHGLAVASIAVGKTVGVAPEADLYFIAETPGVLTGNQRLALDFTWLAQSVNRLLDINATLPPARKIRVISLSVGWSSFQPGYAQISAAVKRATREGVFVISTSVRQTHDLAFQGLWREGMAEPNAAASFGPGRWWAQSQRFWDERLKSGQCLLVPMDSRCTASPTGPDDYVFYSDGGWSWCVPWIAGFYALACQVNPDITPEQFWAATLKTGYTLHLRHDGEDVSFGPIANTIALVEHLRKQMIQQ